MISLELNKGAPQVAGLQELASVLGSGVSHPRGGSTQSCQEHWQVLVTQLLGGAHIEFQRNQKVSLMPKLNSSTVRIQTADPWVIRSSPDARTSNI